MNQPLAPPAYAIAAVERETGLSKDTLRMWERRYGFPVPERDAKGERVYSAGQVLRLRNLRRLIQTGHRPGGVVPLDEPALALLLGVADSEDAAVPLPAARRDAPNKAKAKAAAKPESPASIQSQTSAAQLAVCLRCIAEHDATGLREQLTSAVQNTGLQACVLQLVAPLTRQVGEAWAQGRFAVYEEHFYTECVTGVLRAAIAGVPRADDQAASVRVLLTTTPREQHGLGLLMLEALLALRGCVCLPLGTEMPVADIARAAQLFSSDIVALSFSGVLPANRMQADLADLRSQLPPEIALWAGGQGARMPRGAAEGITVLRKLEDVGAALELRAAALDPAS